MAAAAAAEAEASANDGPAGQDSIALQMPLIETCRYKVEAAFSSEDLYWKDNVRGARFDSTLTTGILYRPDIVGDLLGMVETVLATPVSKGIMVKGPQGIGKSHTLVNLVHKLMYGSNNKYLVTFIPDCEKWQTIFDLLDAICASSGISCAEVKRQMEDIDLREKYYDFLKKFLSSVDDILKSMGKQWVFVFDQINKLFVKPENIHANDASGLAFPFVFIKAVMKPGRITSIISASANNEMAYKEKHEGFIQYHHPLEVALLYDDIDERNANSVMERTSGVPLFVSDLLSKDFDVLSYQYDLYEAVLDSLVRLKADPNVWEDVLQSILAVLLQMESPSHRYDKKFLIQLRTSAMMFSYKPLVPQVLAAYRSYLWKELMSYVEKEESLLLQICIKTRTTNRVRDCHFDTMVIQRCSCSNVDIQVGNELVTIPSARFSYGFRGRQLPSDPVDGLHYPFDPNFPAIDFFLTKGRYIFGVQVHVDAHYDVAGRFWDMCAEAGWFDQFESIHLIYLSHEIAVPNLVDSQVTPPFFNFVITSTNATHN